MIGHVRLIGNHLNCDMYKLVFLAFKYLTILRPKAQISDLDHFFVFGVSILHNNVQYENSDSYISQSVYL